MCMAAPNSRMVAAARHSCITFVEVMRKNRKFAETISVAILFAAARRNVGTFPGELSRITACAEAIRNILRAEGVRGNSAGLAGL